MNEILPAFDETALLQLVTHLNTALESCSDKDWNFSRILLLVRPLESLQTPYMLWPEFVDPVTKQGSADMKALADEIKWGERHSSELGILEIVSLRINKALLATSNELWDKERPVLRLVKKDLLLDQGVRSALWYDVREVTGEDFENR